MVYLISRQLCVYYKKVCSLQATVIFIISIYSETSASGPFRMQVYSDDEKATM